MLVKFVELIKCVKTITYKWWSYAFFIFFKKIHHDLSSINVFCIKQKSILQYEIRACGIFQWRNVIGFCTGFSREVMELPKSVGRRIAVNHCKSFSRPVLKLSSLCKLYCCTKIVIFNECSLSVASEHGLQVKKQTLWIAIIRTDSMLELEGHHWGSLLCCGNKIKSHLICKPWRLQIKQNKLICWHCE